MANHFSKQAAQLLLEALDQGQLPFVTVRSDSMAPLIRQGDQIQLGPIATDSLVPGDVVVLGEPDDLLAHRFWGALDVDDRAYLICRGDSLTHYDPLTPATQLRAVVIARRRAGRTLSLDRGPGAWLNQTLTQLLHFEAQIMQMPPPPSVVVPGQTAQYGFSRRLARRALRVVATLLAALIGVLPG